MKIGGLMSATEGPGWDDLPQRLQQLIFRSLRLQERVRRLDGVLNTNAAPVAENDNPVALQLDRVAQAFGAK